MIIFVLKLISILQSTIKTFTWSAVTAGYVVPFQFCKVRLKQLDNLYKQDAETNFNSAKYD